MWEVQTPTIRSKTLDFESSGQAPVQVSQLFSDDTLVINAIELVDWDGEQTQFLICEACGFVGCKPGDWVSLRSAGTLILIMPAFDSLSQNAESNTEYSPPIYIRRKGIAYLDISSYQSLRETHSSLPMPDQIPKLRMREALLAFQWDAPLRLFGKPPNPFLCRSELVVGASDGDCLEHIHRLEAFGRDNLNNETAVVMRRPTKHDEVVSIFVDGSEFVDWKAVAYKGNNLRPMLGDYVIAPTTEA